MPREVIAMTWDGPVVVHRLPALAGIAAMSRDDLRKTLRRLGVPMPMGATAAEMRDRLIAFPDADDRDAIARAHIGDSGVRPTIRVMDVPTAPSPANVHRQGPAGALPDQRWPLFTR